MWVGGGAGCAHCLRMRCPVHAHTLEVCESTCSNKQCTPFCTIQVGADEKLASVIDGESLINDGSALVIFLVLQQIVQGASLGASEVRRAPGAGACTVYA